MRRPWLGARLQAVDAGDRASLGLERPTGVLVVAVYDKGPAAEAGLRRGDVILAVDGQPVENPEAFGYRFTLKGIEGETNLTILRGGQRRHVPVKLVPPPETRPRDPSGSGRARRSRARPSSTSPRRSPTSCRSTSAATASSWPSSTSGSVAARVGFQKGDMILAINGQRVSRRPRDLERAILRGRGAAIWEITINRAGQTFTTVLAG